MAILLIILGGIGSLLAFLALVALMLVLSYASGKVPDDGRRG